MLKKAVSLFIATCSLSASVMAANVSDAERQSILRGYGYIMGKQTMEASQSQFNLSAEEKQWVLEGIALGARGKESPYNFQEKGPQLEAYLSERSEVQMKALAEQAAKIALENKKVADLYFAKLDKNPKVKKTASGLYYEILSPGSKQHPALASQVKVHYVGTLLDGTEFDNSRARNEAAVFELMQVIPGFQEGIQLIGKGGKIRLHVPSELAYGDRELPGIPANSALQFEVELLDILKGAPKE